jgi:SAM-dependent methyltransferase
LTVPPTYEEVHAKRFALSLEWLRPLLGDDITESPTGSKPRHVLECGGESPFTRALRGWGVDVEGTTHDLRDESNGPADRWDGVLCMEVLEHINDRNPPAGRIAAEWQGDGVRCLLAEIYRWLRPGGWLFLTTPNAASITVLHHAMGLRPPALFRPHVREYAPYELDELVRAAGFAIERRETIDVWRNAISEADHQRIVRFLAGAGYSTELRGEDIFLLARKPG